MALSIHYTPWASALASTYGEGDGSLGQHMACGGIYTSDDVGVASRTLACGTKVQVCYRGCILATVLDRGPYVYSRLFDLQVATARAIGFPNLAIIRYRLRF